jgi:aspartyl-tRNA(Asn)/glutamyl-tRNA(Gln) amidotransferase subunit C
MQIDKNLLKRLQKLSNINLETDEEKKMIEELNRFLSFAEVLEELDTKKVDSHFNMEIGFTKSKTPLRKDIPVNNEAGKTILSKAPESKNDFFIVPKIIE